MTGRAFGVLLMAHGTPDSLEHLAEYLTHVREGRPPSIELIAEMKRRYHAIGGRSPLTDITLSQAAALSQALDGRIPVYVGMRHWHPFVADTLRHAYGEGIKVLLAIPLAPQYSSLSSGRYRDSVVRGTPTGLEVRFIEAWNEHPLLIEAFGEKVRCALGTTPRDVVIFTAHSVPERVIRHGDPYADHVRATASGVAACAGVVKYEIAYQSAARAAESWLGPMLEERLVALARAGVKSALAVPVSFVHDHVEILYDIDIAARRLAGEHGLDLGRTESLNTSDTFIRALADLVLRYG